ncbi:putative Na+/H+ antiporter [Metschnikowia bicuspidata var. bicuspidata NRRL YB-4993]|uniref:Putative Na+/H+ antiporter n=1 Tax=Metschnikowia bicuspidata var. bicuspidata NRRL YB-4993 TaxID=869754 RepID=A0A1A0HEH8_9ASCO|nr:putative Na+/H+ antiporter [Metschnikowia bicuspidata var. bicuspidata NRRL YB-4993]OBA22308.1 putative Na+/H+ antiporter [Metschnikowia bicuspidata var. bicuspidata NRRL YB-4993]
MWAQLEIEQAHIAYACIGIFSTLFSLFSLFVKERLYLGEATVATIAGLILGPHCLNWFDPLDWGNSDYLTLEISRIVLCIQIVAVAVELPRKYMKKHWLSVLLLLLPVMTIGWLTVGLFIWALIPHFDFPSALLVSACVTATDPVLAAAVVGKGKFAERVPGHLRNLLTAESGCNDGMAFPFIFLSLFLIVDAGDAGEIVKNWFTLTILWEICFGIILGVTLGYVLRKAVAFAEKKSLIDRESFLAFFVFLAFNSAGLGSLLGVDDLLVSFAAGTAFGWNGDFAKKTEESHVSTVIDLILNLAFFVYFGAIVPWEDFNNSAIGLDVWRLIVLAIVIIFLRRIPGIMALKPFIPDIKTWREALFCGHFGPIGVGAIFAAILARRDLEEHYTSEETPLAELPDKNFPHYQLIASIWPIVCFIVIVSIIVHGSSVAVLALGKRLNRMAITMSFTTTNTNDHGHSWMSRLQKLENTSTSFSLHRIDSDTETTDSPHHDQHLPKSNTIETSGLKVRPAGGARRKRLRKKAKKRTDDFEPASTAERQRPQAEFLQLGKTPSTAISRDDEASIELDNSGVTQHENAEEPVEEKEEEMTAAIYEDGNDIILEDEDGEVIDSVSLENDDESQAGEFNKPSPDGASIHSMGSLRQHMSQYSVLSDKSEHNTENETFATKLSRTLSGRKPIVKKGSKGKGKRYFAHQVDNLLLIENVDGDIIRRYKLNRHPSVKNRSRSSTLMGKALSMVGIKNKETLTSNDAQLETHPVSQIIPDINIVAAGQSSETKEGRHETLPETSESEQTEDFDSVDETEVEKKRRLAALGHISNGRNDDDEET